MKGYTDSEQNTDTRVIVSRGVMGLITKRRFGENSFANSERCRSCKSNSEYVRIWDVGVRVV